MVVKLQKQNLFLGAFTLLSMATIETVDAVPVSGGFFFDDQQAIKEGAQQHGFEYEGQPKTSGFDRIRQPAEALSILVTLSTGQVAIGDCASVQYAATGGRDPVFHAEDHVDVIENEIAAALVGRDATAFETNVTEFESAGEGKLHTAVQYGVSQALLDAAAQAQTETMTDVLASTYGIEPATEPIPLYSQSGDDRWENSEKMILKGVETLPHGLFNSVEKVGDDGERLVEFIEWLAARVDELGTPDYQPTFHLDVYGTLGTIFDPPYDGGAVREYFADLNSAAGEYPLQIEGPIDAGSREVQIQAMAELREGLADASINVDIVADEWCNTLADIQAFVDRSAADIVQVKTPDLGGIQRSVEAVKYTQGTDTAAYLGGSCAETDISARVSAHIALATKPVQILAKPGMGVDEGIVIVRNEMLRTIRRRQYQSTSPVNDSR